MVVEVGWSWVLGGTKTGPSRHEKARKGEHTSKMLKRSFE